VINITNKTAPKEIAAFDTPGFAGGVAVAGPYIYVADYDSLLVFQLD
jgi:hypothetical protein